MLIRDELLILVANWLLRPHKSVGSNRSGETIATSKTFGILCHNKTNNKQVICFPPTRLLTKENVEGGSSWYKQDGSRAAITKDRRRARLGCRMLRC